MIPGRADQGVKETLLDQLTAEPENAWEFTSRWSVKAFHAGV